MNEWLELIETYDDVDKNTAHNVYMDYFTGDLYIERVWNNEGVTVVHSDGKVASMTPREFNLLRTGEYYE